MSGYGRTLPAARRRWPQWSAEAIARAGARFFQVHGVYPDWADCAREGMPRQWRVWRAYGSMAAWRVAIDAIVGAAPGLPEEAPYDQG